MSLPVPIAALHRELGIPEDYAARRGLPFQPEAPTGLLVRIDPGDVDPPVRLLPGAAAAWRRLEAAAALDGITLLPVSGFRSVARQAEIIRRRRAAGRPLDDILRYIAAPGFSEHHSGRALDIGCPGHTDLEENFAGTPAFRWLERHAPAAGFRLSYPQDNPWGIGYEPWHWYCAGAPDA
ncbi:MAG: M15 family metallopeptidase [Opitutaceae bacterium]